MKFEIVQTDFPGLFLMHVPTYADHRGSLTKVFEVPFWQERGIDIGGIKESYISVSHKYVFRGLHFQVERPQGKVIFPISGKLLDIAVDMRKGSPTYGKVHSTEIEPYRTLIYVPRGFAHGILALEDNTVYVAYQTEAYMTGSEGGVHWEYVREYLPVDGEELILSDRDKSLPRFEDIESPFTYNPENLY